MSCGCLQPLTLSTLSNTHLLHRNSPEIQHRRLGLALWIKRERLRPSMIQRGQSFRPSAKVLSKVLGGDTHTRSLSHTRTHIHTHTHTHTQTNAVQSCCPVPCNPVWWAFGSWFDYGNAILVPGLPPFPGLCSPRWRRPVNSSTCRGRWTKTDYVPGPAILCVCVCVCVCLSPWFTCFLLWTFLLPAPKMGGFTVHCGYSGQLCLQPHWAASMATFSIQQVAPVTSILLWCRLDRL